VFYLPPYSPELNPVEYLNNDMKGAVNESGLPENREGCSRFCIANYAAIRGEALVVA
jgi:transposase